MKKLFFSLVLMLFSVAITIGQTTKPKSKAPAKPGNAPAVAKVSMKSLIDSFSYAAGLNIAENMKQQGITGINAALLAKAIDDVFKNKTVDLTPELANSCLQNQLSLFNEKKNEVNAKKSAAEVAKGKAYLDENKKRAGVITLPDGLQYEIIKEGDPAGIKPTVQDTVVVNYVGKLIDGTEFDSSTKNGGPVSFPVGGVIKGWTEILQLMTKGAHWKVHIPSDLAYGDRGAGPTIAPGATLIFDIMLEDVKPAATK